MAAPKPISKILTANRLRTGDTVYYTADGVWSPHVSDARVATTAEDVQVLTDAGAAEFKKNAVIDVALVDVRPGTHVEPAHIREIIRSTGPTVRLDLNKSASSAQ